VKLLFWSNKKFKHKKIMARQKGIINFEGKAGNLSFYKTRDGYAARTADGINGSRVKNDPSYIRTRENGVEFGKAGKAGKLIRNFLRPYLLNLADSRVTSRLTTDLLKVTKTDLVHDRGLRVPASGDLQILNGFQFNGNTPLGLSILAPFTASFNRQTGLASIDFVDFDARHMIKAPQGATHFRMLSAVASFNFEAETSLGTLHTPAPFLLALDDVEIHFEIPMPPGFEAQAVFIALGIEFLQLVNNKEYPLKDNSANALAIVDVNMPV
jgi:hypothetical protein